MTKPPSTLWAAAPHNPIEELAFNLWRVEAPVPNMAVRRVMTVVKMSDGGLLLHSAIALDEPSMQRLEQWGEPRYIVVPNAFHRADCGKYKARYPQAQVVCPSAARRKVEQVVAVDGDYHHFPPSSEIQLRHLAGTKEREGVLVVQHGEQHSVVLNDIVFNMPHLSGLTGWTLRHVTKSSGGPRVSRIAQIALVSDAAQVADDLRQLAETPGLARVIVSHHEIIADQAAVRLREAADGLHRI
jgi:hypothetical protein